MNAKGKWDKSQIDEWHRRYRQVVEVPVEVTVETPVELPPVPMSPDAFRPARKNHGPN